jgi:O-antigen/teichoic acid export membrane protein
MSADKLVTILVGALAGAPVAAQYKVASQVGSSLMLFSSPFYQVIYPSLSKMVARRQWLAVFTGLGHLRRYTLMVAIPLAAVISGLMVPLLPLIFGEEFTDAVVPGLLIVWAALPGVVYFLRRPLLLSLGEAGRLTKYRAVVSAVQLILVIALVGPIDALGAGIAIFVMNWLYAGLELRLIGLWRRRLLVEEAFA